MTPQEALDKIYAEIRGPRKRALGPTLVCAFRGSDGGSRCFIGMLMTPEQLDAAMSAHWRTSQALDVLGFAPKDHDTMRDIQLVHDRCATSEWDAELREVAKRNGLTVPGDCVVVPVP